MTTPPRPTRRRCFMAALALFAALLGPARPAWGDGGVVRLAQRRGELRITVFTPADPVRAGPIDVSVLVQHASSGEMVPNARVRVTAEAPGRRIEQAATTEAATNKLLQAAILELPDAGRWEITVAVEGVPEGPEGRFAIDVGAPVPPGAALVPWIAWPAVVVVVFAAHEWRSRRRSCRRRKAEPGETYA